MKPKRKEMFMFVTIESKYRTSRVIAEEFAGYFQAPKNKTFRHSKDIFANLPRA